MPGIIQVAVAVLQRPDGQVLVAHRGSDRHQGGKLEFPGGKIEPGEHVIEALRRELEEELGIEPTECLPLIRIRHDYADRSVELLTHLVTQWQGNPRGCEGQPVEWLSPATLTASRFPAANRPIVAALRLPALSLVTPTQAEPSPASLQALLDSVERALRNEPVLLVRFRAPELERDAWIDRVQQLAELVGRYRGSRLLANGPPERAEDLPPSVGLHLSADDARRTRERPVGPDRLLSCACHDAAEVERAGMLDADLAYVGPVAATPTHPGAQILGWEGLSRLAARTTIPLYGIGGLTAEDLTRAREAGAIGVAGIRAFLPGS